jgi:hypothetical protein
VPCTRIYRFYWFMVAFEIIIILGALICAATHKVRLVLRPESIWCARLWISLLRVML